MAGKQTQTENTSREMNEGKHKSKTSRSQTTSMNKPGQRAREVYIPRTPGEMSEANEVNSTAHRWV